jgi:hypothetical protein
MSPRRRSVKALPIDKAGAERQAKIGRNIDRALAVEMGLAAPAWMKKQSKGGPQVARAKSQMRDAFPNEEWRTMRIVAVRKGCEPIARARQEPLASLDSFARAMGRRK